MSSHDYAILEKTLEHMKLKLHRLELDKKMTESLIKELKKDIKHLNWLLH